MSHPRPLDPTINAPISVRLRRLQAQIMSIGANPPPGADSRVYAARTWYHDFSGLGVVTNFNDHPSLGERAVRVVRRTLGKPPLGSQANQVVKNQQILPALELAFRLFEANVGRARSFLDTFSADGYYAFWAVKEGHVEQAECVDLREEYLAQGRLMSHVLALPQVKFVRLDVYEMPTDPVDVALCAGGLYHVTDPVTVLHLLKRAKVLVAQSIVTTHTEDPEFFVSPAPGLRHGCRFTHHHLELMLRSAGWHIVNSQRDIVSDARDEYSMGSSVFVCHNFQSH